MMSKKFIIEITDFQIKFLHVILRASQAPRIISLGIEEIGPGFLSGISRQISKDTEVVALFPRRLAILRVLAFPSLVEDEIRGMIRFQTIGQMPLRPEELIWDYHTVERDPAGLTKVLLMAAPRDAVERYLTVFQNAKLRVDKLVLGSLGWLGWSSYQRQICHDLPDDPFVLIHSDETYSEICLIEGDQLLFSRSVDVGLKDFSAERLSFFHRQWTLTLDYYAKEWEGKPPGKILLLGESPRISCLEEMLKKTDLSVQRMDPGENLPEANGCDLACLWGVAFAQERTLNNLLPGKIRQKNRSQKRAGQWKSLGLLSLSILLLGFLSMAFNIQNEARRLESLQDQMKKLRPLAKEAENKRRQVHFIKDQMNQRIFVADFIRELSARMPEGVFLTSFQLNDHGHCILQGLTEERSQVGILQQHLLSSSFFNNVSLEYLVDQRIDQRKGTHFRLSCQIAQIVPVKRQETPADEPQNKAVSYE